MNSTKWIISGVLLTFVFHCRFVEAGFVLINEPTSPHPLGGSYLSATTKQSIAAAEFDIVDFLDDGTLRTTFSDPMQVLQVDVSWATWSSPPLSEDPFPTVLWSQGGSTVTLDFNLPVSTFGFELQPNLFGPSLFTVNWYNGNDIVGTVAKQVDGSGGALLFAGAVDPLLDPLFTSVLISGAGQDFAIAQLRYEVGTQTVPEPTTFAIFSGVLVSMLLLPRTRGRCGRPGETA